MVRVYKRRPVAPRVSYRKGRKFGPNRPSVNLISTVSSATNSRTDAQNIQTIITNHFPGAVTSWNNVAYKVYTARELVNLVNTAFQNSLQLKLTGVKVYAQSDNSTTLAVCFRQATADHLRVVSGIGRVKATFNFKNRELPQYLILLGETDASFKITFYYDRNLISSQL